MEHLQPQEQESKELSKAAFHKRLTAILNVAISVDNIDNYSERTLDSLISLTGEIVAKYRQEITHTSAKGDALENEAYAYYGLTDIGDVLTRAQEKLTQIESINHYIASHSEESPEVITPPDTYSIEVDVAEGDGTFNDRILVPRLATLLYILENDLGLSKEDAILTKGTVLDTMMRNEPYYRVEISELNRVVYLCDEEGNASYIFNAQKLAEANIGLEQLDTATKDDRNALIMSFPGIGARLIQTSRWRDRIVDLLSSDIPVASAPQEEGPSQNGAEISGIITSELDPMRGYWVDAEGKHWGGATKLCRSLDMSITTLHKIIDQYPGLRRMDALDSSKGWYCYEEIAKLPEVKKHHEEIPILAREGDWLGFYEDPEGMHWGPIFNIAEKIGLDSITVKADIVKAELRKLKVRAAHNHQRDGYCYEKVIVIPHIADLISLPKSSKDGDWRGYYVDEQGRHWGGIKMTARRLDATIALIKRLASKLDKKKIIDPGGQLIDQAICLESLEALEEFNDYMKLPFVPLKGKDSYIDPSGERWGSIPQLARAFGLENLEDIRNILVRMHKMFLRRRNLEVRSDIKSPISLYSYDELLLDEEFQKWLTTLHQD